MNIKPHVRAASAVLVLTLLVAIGLPARAGAAGLVLVEDGVSRAPIVLFEDAPPKTRQAAEELASYIEKISGARPELIEGEPEPLPEHAIWVGYQPVLDGLFPEVGFDFQHPEEILIAANEDHLVIAGRDRWNPDHLTGQTDRGEPIVGVQQEYGTANAVYTFLQDYLDVRWLWPGASGVDVVERETLAFEPFEYRYHPRVRARSGLFRYSAFETSSLHGHSQDWARHQRLQLDSLGVPGNHAFTDWWERFHETHPEYFALQPDGTRSGFPAPHKAKLCMSNPAVWDQWLKDVARQLEEHPNRTVFNVSPNDSWNRGICICEDCRAWDHPDGEPVYYAWQGVSQQYVAMSDRQVTFANTLGRMLEERYPDKDYYVSMMAYGSSRPAPVEAVPDDNVLVLCVANFILQPDIKDAGSSKTHRERFAAWSRVTDNLLWRPNTGSPAGWKQGLPDVPFTRAMGSFGFAADRGYEGVWVDSVWEHWATQGPLYYVMGQMVWNPGQDWRAVLDDYYQRGFGPAAAQIEAYWALMERTREEYVAADSSYPEVYDAAFFDRAYALLDRASEAVATGPEKYRERIAFVRAGTDYTKRIMDIRTLMAQYLKSGKSDAAAADKVRAQWDEIKKITEAYPHGINWSAVAPHVSRMEGLHPDHLD